MTILNSKNYNAQHKLKDAFVAALPIIAGYTVLGIPCGILGIQAGLTVSQIAIMSLLFYSGAGQYMIPNMLMTATPIGSIIVSVALVNTRQILYSASLSRFLKNTGKPLSFLFAATVTDESFGVNLGRFSYNKNNVEKRHTHQNHTRVKSDKTPQADLIEGWTVTQATAVNLLSLGTWTLANITGAIAGTLFTFPSALASFAMTSIFICLLFMQRFKTPTAIAAIVAAIGVMLCKILGLSGPAILIGAIAGIIAALLVNSATRTTPNAIVRSKGNDKNNVKDDVNNKVNDNYKDEVNCNVNDKGKEKL